MNGGYRIRKNLIIIIIIITTTTTTTTIIIIIFLKGTVLRGPLAYPNGLLDLHIETIW
jgi:hypothetical protein